MTKSATGREATSRRINRCALRLADEHGLDGFTMEDLAEAAGVSRRTLFNYFPGKVDAVLGHWKGLDAADVETFRAGGPHHDLMLDLRELVIPILGEKVDDRTRIAQARRVLRGNPRLLGAVHDRYEAVCAEVIDHIVAREGDGFPRADAQIAVAVLAGLLDVSLDAFLNDTSGRQFFDHFDHSLAAAARLLGS
ncbi:TetR/AcrR family transcriptional regulator [Nocardioides sp. GXZ039]|uniref:TetR/AcrR family transcriptional regulator n=1 Tax=Nocardioides sp. GXZ039 TaxID=3136018 RepID=UPI0030F4992B